MALPAIPTSSTGVLASLGQQASEMATVWYRAFFALFKAVTDPLANDKALLFVDGDAIGSTANMKVDKDQALIQLTKPAFTSSAGLTISDPFNGGQVVTSVLPYQIYAYTGFLSDPVAGSVSTGYVLAASTVYGFSFTARNPIGSSYNGLGSPITPQVITLSGTVDFTVTGGIVTAFTAVSDRRLKNDEGRFSPGLAAICALSAHNRYYSWNAKASARERLKSGHELPTGKHLGFFAQDVQAAMPEAVSETEDGYLNYDRQYLMHALINAVSELKGEVDALRNRN